MGSGRPVLRVDNVENTLTVFYEQRATELRSVK
jgi:hypothetical protein